MRKIHIIILLMCVAVGLFASTEWLHIYHHGNRVSSAPLADVPEVWLPDTDDNFGRIAFSGAFSIDSIDMWAIDSVAIGKNIPTISINVDEGREVVSKEEYLDAEISGRGWGEIPDFDTTRVQIRGRGNSTWGAPKKPYRLKFSKKQSLFGFKKAKSYVLIANYIDETLMRNVIEMEIAQRLGVEFCNHYQPVNLCINGRYRGSYLLTEKVGINSGSVDIDETQGVLLELDSYYDEPYRFRSNMLNLPVMIKDPDLDELAADNPDYNPDHEMAKWFREFNRMESVVMDVNSTAEEFATELDVEAAAKYLLIYNITLNREINHPKSTYLYKRAPGKPFTLGPPWDFDWAYNFMHPSYIGYLYYNNYDEENVGHLLMLYIASRPEVMEAYERYWQIFLDEIWPEIPKFCDDYAQKIRVSALQNGELYPLISTLNFDAEYAKLRQWLDDRVEWLKGAPNYGLFPDRLNPYTGANIPLPVKRSEN